MSDLSKMSVEELDNHFSIGYGGDDGKMMLDAFNACITRLRAAEADRDEWKRRAEKAEGVVANAASRLRDMLENGGHFDSDDLANWDRLASQQPTGGEVADG